LNCMRNLTCRSQTLDGETIGLADKTNIDTACGSNTACGTYIHKNTQFSNNLALLMALKYNRTSNL
jgi:hypothetical protein